MRTPIVTDTLPEWTLQWPGLGSVLVTRLIIFIARKQHLRGFGDSMDA
jgi:hypothetical protein